MKRTRKPTLASWAMFAAILFATLGPGFCRALMAADAPERPAVTCCHDESPRNPAQNENNDSCPLHAVGHIQLLPAASRAALSAPAAPLTDAPAFAAPAFAPEFFAPTDLLIQSRPPGPAPNPRTPLYLLIASLRI